MIDAQMSRMTRLVYYLSWRQESEDLIVEELQQIRRIRERTIAKDHWML